MDHKLINLYINYEFIYILIEINHPMKHGIDINEYVIKGYGGELPLEYRICY